MAFGVNFCYLECNNSGHYVWWGPYLAIAGVLNSGLSLGYYAWIIRKMYLEEGENRIRQREPKSIVAD